MWTTQSNDRATGQAFGFLSGLGYYVFFWFFFVCLFVFFCCFCFCFFVSVEIKFKSSERVRNVKNIEMDRNAR